MVFLLRLFMRVLIPCLFSSPVFCIVLFLSTQQRFCLLFATVLCLSCFLNSPPSHWVTSSKCHHPAQPFPSILLQPCHPDWCWFVPGLPDHTAALGPHMHWSNLSGVNNSPLSIFQKTLNIPLSITSQSHILFVTYNKVGTPFLFPRFLIFNKEMLLLSTKIVPKNFEFKGYDIWKLPYEKIWFSWTLSPHCSSDCVLCLWMSVHGDCSLKSPVPPVLSK